MFQEPEKYSKTAKEILSTSEIMAAASDLIIKQFSTLLLEWFRFRLFFKVFNMQHHAQAILSKPLVHLLTYKGEALHWHSNLISWENVCRELVNKHTTFFSNPIIWFLIYNHEYLYIHNTIYYTHGSSWWTKTFHSYANIWECLLRMPYAESPLMLFYVRKRLMQWKWAQMP